MEKIFISDDDVKLTIFISDNNIFYCDYDTNADINKYLDLLKNVDEDYFNKNAVDSVLYMGSHGKLSRTKKLYLRNAIAVTTMSAIIALNAAAFVPNNPNVTNVPISYVFNVNDDLTLNNIKNKIYASVYLNSSEKEFLFNKEFFEDLLPLINANNYLKNKFNDNLTNVNIASFGKEHLHYDDYLGYYKRSEPNRLYIKDYKHFDEYEKGVVSHEFVHLCQEACRYNVISEACAEIISSEYYNKKNSNSYVTQVKLVKELMEIIGPEPVWLYTFTGNFKYIEMYVKPYLSNAEYKLLLQCLEFDYNKDESKKFYLLELLLSNLYKAKYDENIKDNEVISQLEANNKSLVRNYFNNRVQESYYLDYVNLTQETVDLQTAMDYGVVNIYICKETPISYDEAIRMQPTPNSSIRRIIEPKINGFTMFGTTQSHNKMFVNCLVEGQKYTDVDVDYLVEAGYLDINYYSVETYRLSAEDYINHNYSDDFELKILNSESTVINEDFTVTTMLPTKVYLPSINEKSYHL